MHRHTKFNQNGPNTAAQIFHLTFYIMAAVGHLDFLKLIL